MHWQDALARAFTEHDARIYCSQCAGPLDEHRRYATCDTCKAKLKAELTAPNPEVGVTTTSDGEHW